MPGLQEGIRIDEFNRALMAARCSQRDVQIKTERYSAGGLATGLMAAISLAVGRMPRLKHGRT
jgi:hypothetical protein